jgi:hypothetical protein
MENGDALYAHIAELEALIAELEEEIEELRDLYLQLDPKCEKLKEVDNNTHNPRADS